MRIAFYLVIFQVFSFRMNFSRSQEIASERPPTGPGAAGCSMCFCQVFIWRARGRVPRPQI